MYSITTVTLHPKKEIFSKQLSPCYYSYGIDQSTESALWLTALLATSTDMQMALVDEGYPSH